MRSHINPAVSPRPNFRECWRGVLVSLGLDQHIEDLAFGVDAITTDVCPTMRTRRNNSERVGIHDFDGTDVLRSTPRA